MKDLLQNIAPAAPERVLPGDAAWDRPTPTDLPISLSYKSEKGNMEAVRPWNWDSISKRITRAPGARCVGCGRQPGDDYVKVVLNDDGTEELVTRQVPYLQAMHLTNDPMNCRPDALAPGCPSCHGNSEHAHRYGSTSMTIAADPEGTRLTQTRALKVLSLVRRETMRNPETPFQSMGAGGLDMLVAVTMAVFGRVDRETLSHTIPEIRGQDDETINLCVTAALKRMWMRGMLNADMKLKRELMLPAEVTETPGKRETKRSA